MNQKFLKSRDFLSAECTSRFHHY